MSECEGCFQPIEECCGYGSCVPRLKAQLAKADALAKAAKSCLEYWDAHNYDIKDSSWPIRENIELYQQSRSKEDSDAK